MINIILRSLMFLIAFLFMLFLVLGVIAVICKRNSIYLNAVEQRNPYEGKRVVFIENNKDSENADGVRGHLEPVGECLHRSGAYEKIIKRLIDIVFSFGGLVILSPVYMVIAIAIFIDDPGPVIFTQKRLGRNKRYFKLHKFRSMKMSTPHDMPTHMLDNPDEYITKVGRFIRSHSLDELPQIWDIFIGNMSIVGPRPALWNQDLLTAERDKYGANDIKPGLTGWAQINGRDELEIPEKAKMDGEYVKKIGLIKDFEIFLRSLGVIRKDSSIVEGSSRNCQNVFRNHTGNKSNDELIGHIGFDETVNLDLMLHKRVLITAIHSYIGNSFAEYVRKKYYDNFVCDLISTRDDEWKNLDFSKYDVIFHVAGIAHSDVEKVSYDVKEAYYKINTDLTIDIAQKAKCEGVKEFIFLSSMIVYGDAAPYGISKIIDEKTIPKASNYYGDSKLQADVAVRELASDDFKVLVLRLPMVYGLGSKGNYSLLSKYAKKLPLFPKTKNNRSMIYIDNLCEFICQLLLINNMSENSVVLFPQNSEWTNTSEMVRIIAQISNKKLCLIGFLNVGVVIGGKMPGKIGRLVIKAFGNNCYDQSISVCPGMDYQIVGLYESLLDIEQYR